MKHSYADAHPYVTKDGSTIRELAHPATSEAENLSLAEARLAPGQRTKAHLHRTSEEIYHFTAGQGWMELAGERFRVAPGDTVVIPPGSAHHIENDPDAEMVVLCACHPAYEHDDTSFV